MEYTKEQFNEIEKGVRQDLLENFRFIKNNIINKLDSYEDVPESLTLDIIKQLNLFEKMIK